MRLTLALLPIVAAVSGCKERPPDQAMLDGVYENPECPGFEVRGGAIRVSVRELWGRLEKDGNGLYLLPEKALRYETGEKGCRLLVDDAAIKLGVVLEEPGGEAVGLEIPSADGRETMIWSKRSWLQR
jgi:hypothetical protein